MSTANVVMGSNVVMDVPETTAKLDERVQIVGKIFHSVGICAVVWGADALLHHAISTVKQVIPPPSIQKSLYVFTFYSNKL